MNKNIKMLKIYRRVLKGNQEETKLIIPNMYAKNFYTIDFKYLLENNIKNLIIDIDGTILPADDVNVPKVLIEKIKVLKENGFNICLVSNNKESRVVPVANILKVEYLYKAKKPLKECYDKSIEILKENDLSKVAMIGDQMLTDVYGANTYGIYSVLVKPISKKNNIGTFINRCLQKRIERYLKKKNIFDSDNYY